MLTEEERQKLVACATRRRDAGIAAVEAEYERDVAMIEAYVALPAQLSKRNGEPHVSRAERFKLAAIEHIHAHGNVPLPVSSVAKAIGVQKEAWFNLFTGDERFVVAGARKPTVRCA